jgi:hypothetical protein
LEEWIESRPTFDRLSRDLGQCSLIGGNPLMQFPIMISYWWLWKTGKRCEIFKAEWSCGIGSLQKESLNCSICHWETWSCAERFIVKDLHRNSRYGHYCHIRIVLLQTRKETLRMALIFESATVIRAELQQNECLFKALVNRSRGRCV